MKTEKKSRPSKPWNLIVGHGKSWKIEVMFVGFVPVHSKTRTNGTHFGGH